LRGVSFSLRPRAVLGVIGETGSGKTTLVQACLGLLAQANGSVRVRGEELIGRTEYEVQEIRRRMQIIYQDPQDAIDPVYSVGGAVVEPLVATRPVPARRALQQDFSGSGEAGRIAAALRSAGLGIGLVGRRREWLSGGEQQRVSIARSIVEVPAVLFADEAVSALDVSVQQRILVLLRQLVESMGVALVFVSHDLAVVRAIADDVLILREGEVQEYAAAEAFFGSPKSGYGRALLNAARRTEVRHA
jgi:peptide/nickel transport system ATP-binding protein